MRKNIKYSLLALLAVMGMASCSNEYEYEGADAVTKSQVFFSDKTIATTSYELDMNATSFDVEIQRSKTEGELTVNLENRQNPASTTQLTVPTSVTFADGEATATITITYDPSTIEFDDVNRDTLMISSEELISEYAGAEYRFSAFIPAPWEDMGMALYREDLVTHWFGVDNLIYKVPIQKDLTRPGVYRLVNPYGEYYPYNEDGDYDPDALSYMVLHAEDPDHVWMEYTETTMNWNADYGKFRFWSMAEYYMRNAELADVIAAHPEAFGTMKNDVITMPAKSILISMELYNDGGFYQANDNGLFAIALPGASLYTPDYTTSASYIGMLNTAAGTSEAVVELKKAVDVAKAVYVLTKADYSESVVADALIAGQIEGVELTADSVRVNLPVEEEGKYRVTIVGFDEEGAAQSSASCVFEYEKGGSSWESLGMCMYTDDLVGYIFEADPVSYEVEVLASTKTPGLYRLKNPYGAAYPYNEEGDWDDSRDYFLEINAVDPTAVYVEEQELGLDWGYGMFKTISEGAYWMAAGYDIATIKANDIEFGTLENGVITFPVQGFRMAMADYNSGKWSFYGNANGAFKLVLPSAPAAVKAMAKIRANKKSVRKAARVVKAAKIAHDTLITKKTSAKSFK